MSETNVAEKKMRDNSLDFVVSSVEIVNNLQVKVETTSRDGKYHLISDIYCFPEEIIKAMPSYMVKK